MKHVGIRLFIGLLTVVAAYRAAGNHVGACGGMGISP